MFTKTQAKIMEVFVSKITERFSIKQISEIVEKPYALIHRSVMALLDKDLLIKDKQNYISLNYRQNHPNLAYVESLRSKEFLKKNKTIALFMKDVLEKMNQDFFILLVFGSAVKKQNPRDIDVLLILPNNYRPKNQEIRNKEKLLLNLASNFSLDFDINVVAVESIYEMLSKRDQLNVMNETLNNHFIILGAENYYRLLKNAR